MDSLYSTDQIKCHLGKYKQEKLKVYENGIWVNNKKEYPHILPYNKRSSNLIDKEYMNSLLLHSLNSGKTLHPGFHHLNSSQALAINLFVPFIAEKKLECLLNNYGINDSIKNSQFEYVEDKNEGTNFDFFIEGKNINYYIEVKYSEDKFGYARDDKPHRDKFEKIYSPKFKSIYPIEWDDFRKEYQLWRNISYLDKGHIFFVFPEFRNDLTKIVNNAKEKISNSDNVHILYIDQIISIFRSVMKEKNEHYKEFAEKYLLIDGI